MASGEGDPAVPSAGEGSSRGGSHQRDKALILRSKKRVGALREEVSRAQLIVQETEAKLASEENALRDGELRL